MISFLFFSGLTRLQYLLPGISSNAKSILIHFQYPVHQRSLFHGLYKPPAILLSFFIETG